MEYRKEKSWLAEPWRVNSGMVETKQGVPIAHMDRSYDNGTLPVERDANAKAIAALPELIDVLQWVKRRWDKYDEADAPELGRAIRETLKKAGV